MRIRIRLLAPLLGLCAAIGAHAAEPPVLDPEQLFERLAPSVWLVETFDARNQPLSRGSGVVIGPQAVITNCHVLARARRVSIARENVSYGATLEFPDTERDLCQLKVANLAAPSVSVAAGEQARVGARVYAIGNPRGLEQTLSDGLLSGIRRSADGEFTALQVTVPISPGSSGGGLFDSRGRLIGITTFSRRDGQNLNFALPAAWVLQVPARAQAALAAREQSGKPLAQAGGGTQFVEYQLRDRLTGVSRPVVYRLDRLDGDRLLYNQGSRIEKRGGEVVGLTAAIAGDFEQAMPPGGWVREEPAPGAVWSLNYDTALAQHKVKMELTARTVGETTYRFKERELRVVQVQFDGYTGRTVVGASSDVGGQTGRGAYLANAWYAPELGRVVRFDVRTRGGMSGSFFFVDEVLELADIRTE
jgi:hypothetical protein